MFLPLLPATPFLILTAICFDRASPKFHSWLLAHPLFGPPIRDWKANGAIRPRYKVIASLSLAVGSLFVLPKPEIPLVGKLLYGLTVAGVMIFIWTRPGKTPKSSP